MRICLLEGCGSKHYAKDLCERHYKSHKYATNAEKEKAKRRKWRAANQQTIKERRRAYHVANSAKISAKAVAWAKRNPKKRKANIASWMKAHAGSVNANTARRRATKRNATPFWANTFFIQEAYRLATLRTKVTGLPWHVDHIVPLKSEVVCGLHCEANLQVIPAVLNRSKHNRFWPHQPL